MIGAARPEEVVIGRSTTLLLQQLARAMAASFRPGDEIVVTDVDHESNIGPWRALESQGVVFREWQVDPLTPRARPGGARPAARTAHAPGLRHALLQHPGHGDADPRDRRRAHAAGAELCVDGVAYAPHRRVDVQALGVDWYVFSFYKTFGPHLAVLWGRYERLLELDGLNHFFYGRDRVPYKLQPGNLNYELAWGCAGIPDYLDQLDRPPWRRRFRADRGAGGSAGERACWTGSPPATTCA